jgi:hypothetical protein
MLEPDHGVGVFLFDLITRRNSTVRVQSNQCANHVFVEPVFSDISTTLSLLHEPMNKYLSKAYGSQAAFRPLLPFEPEILDGTTQAGLTERFLLSELAELEAFFLAARAMVDPDLQNKQPIKLGKPYPLGQCLEISLAVKKLLRKNLDTTQLNRMATHGYAAFSAFLAAGGAFRHVWGDLRGEYFQNAYQLGTLYVDVSNDTVTLTKPKVEILPFAQSRFVAVTDFHHYRRLAERYWQDTIFPNHVLPDLAPYCPFVHVNRKGGVGLRDNSSYMIALAQARQFVASEEVLNAQPMPADIFNHVAAVLAGSRSGLASSPAEGRALALRRCREYRNKRWYASTVQTGKILASISAVNARLGRAPSVAHLYTGPGTLDIAIQKLIPVNHSPRYIPVSKSTHAGKTWCHKRADDSFNSDLVIPLTTREMFEAMMAMPLAFVAENGGFNPVAIRGFAAGNNTFAIADCRWPAGYVPEVYRHYPFSVTRTGTGEQLLSIDENGGLLDDIEQGKPLFNSDGSPTDEVLEIMASITQAEANREATSRCCAVLQRYGLIQPWPLKLQLGTLTKNTTGLCRIDEDGLNQVPAETVAELQQSGALAIAYCQLLSMQNFQLQQYRKLPATGFRQQ